MMIQIKTHDCNSVLFEGEYDSLAACVEAAVKEGVTLHGVNLSGAKLNGANLNGADLRGANLHYADLDGANLCYADLRHADLCHASLASANLNGANFSTADLRHADLSSANLCRTRLNGANLDNVDLGSCAGNRVEIHSIFVSGVYPVTYTSEVMQIGCERYKISDWWEFDDATIFAMDGEKALKFWRKHKNALKNIIEANPAKRGKTNAKIISN